MSNDRRPSRAFLLGALALSLLVAACATSPTGRTQLVAMPESEMAAMGTTAFEDMKKTNPISKDAAETAYVRCVATSITDVLAPQELAGLAITSWEVVLFEEPSANAFALPGGKIGVHTGLLEVARTQDQLATVLGHEVAHVLARHGNERVTQSSLAEMGMGLVQVLAGVDTPEKQQLFGLLGVGMQYGVLMPFGRSQESEADEVGLMLMARAGFDPRQSITLWQNMEAASGGMAPPEILSTHPSHGTRIERLNAKMTDAMKVQAQAKAAGRTPSCR
jgi:predicted Zn-dependent protease